MSDTTLDYDRGRKLRKYAERAVAEVWLVNLKNMTIEQHREPSGMEYSHARTYQRGEEISILAFPQVNFAVEELIG